MKHADCLDVYVVDVGALLTVDLYADEVPIHDVRDIGVGEGFVGHDVTPVAGGISDGYDYGLVLAFCKFEGFLAPRQPIDRVFGMLAEVKAGFVG